MATIQEILDKINASKSNNVNNNSFIDLMRQISGNPEDATAPVNDTNSIYGHIVQMYTTLYDSGVDYAVLVDDIEAIQGLYERLNAIDSLYADKTKLDSLYADKAKLDQLFADKAVIDRVYGSITNIDRVHTSIDKLDTVYTSVLKMDTVADNISDVNTVADNMIVLNEIYNNRVEIYAADNNATVATTKAIEASNSATTATTKASEASASALASSTASSASITKATESAASAVLANTSAGSANTSAASASSNATIATTKASEASVSASNASTSAATASTKASAAATSASTSATKATEAATSASTALGYKNDVSAMKLAIETIYDTFDDRFLGTKTTNPVLDNDGNALIDGAMYFDTTTNAMKVYDAGTTTWYSIPQIYLSGLLDVELISITTGDILVWNGLKWSNTANPKVDSIQLNGGSGTEGTISWNSTEQTLDITQDGTTLQVGQELQYIVRNDSGNTIANGTFVGFAGVTSGSNRIIATPFNTSTMAAMKLIGFATEDIANGVNGRVTNFGYVRGLDTRGTAVTGMSVGDEDWSKGDILYVHPTAAGKLTKVAPTSGIKAPVATVTNRHQTAGELFVNVIAVDQLKIDHGESAYNRTTNIDNTSDSSKPVSTAQQTALNLKAPLTSAALVNPTINGIAQSGYTGFKNYIINGSMAVNQYPGFTPTDGYKYDRWGINGGTNFGTIVQTPLNGEASSNMALGFTKTNSAVSWIWTKIEFPRILAGKTVTLSFRAYSNTGHDMSTDVYFDKYNPTDGFTNATIGQTFTWNNSWRKRTMTFTLPTLGTNFNNNNSYFQLCFSMLGTTNEAYLTDVQLEEGSVATPFENRPYGLELSLCQRYYEKICFNFGGNVPTTNGYVAGSSQYSVTKRVLPTLNYGNIIQNENIYSLNAEAQLTGYRIWGLCVPNVQVTFVAYGYASAEL